VTERGAQYSGNRYPKTSVRDWSDLSGWNQVDKLTENNNMEDFYFEKIAIWGLAAAPIIGTFLVLTNYQLARNVSPVFALYQNNTWFV